MHIANATLLTLQRLVQKNDSYMHNSKIVYDLQQLFIVMRQTIMVAVSVLNIMDISFN